MIVRFSMIQNTLPTMARRKRSQEIADTLGKFQGLKSIPQMHVSHIRPLIANMRSDQREILSNRDDIASLFADYYERLYSNPDANSHTTIAACNEPIPAFTMEEFRQALRGLRKGKARDDYGIIAEMILSGGQQLWTLLLDVFNGFLDVHTLPPESWLVSRIVVLFKKGDASEVANYRPISIICVVYKLFSRILCNRMSSFLIPEQSPEQAAYKKKFSVEDHLLTVHLLIEKCKEWNLPLWVTLVDFTKAFDSVKHEALWKVLRDQGLPDAYIRILQKLYGGARAYVHTDVASRCFCLQRGVRQGDPISALLFISIIEACMRECKNKWSRLNQRRTRHGFGILLDGCEPLTNLRFADDILLASQSKTDASKMLADLASTAAKYGLQVHFGKTKVMTTEQSGGEVGGIKLNGQTIHILGLREPEKYLGRQLCVQDSSAVEIEYRIKCSWASFMTFKKELCNRHYPLTQRLRLFNATVTPSACYAAATWTMTKSLEQRVRVTQRKMLRMILYLRRAADEEWEVYMRRSTYRLKAIMVKHNVEDWVKLQRKRKWRFAGKTALFQDGRWSRRIFEWRPALHGHRRVGAPNTRWEDDIVEHVGGNWTQIATDTQLWGLMENAFIETDV